MKLIKASDFLEWTDPALEARIINDISLDVPWEIVERFSTLVRLSGSEEERQAFNLLIGKLQEWGVDHTLHEPLCFISWPIAATLRVHEAPHTAFRVKTTAMSVSTDGAELTGQLVFAPAAKGDGVTDDWSTGIDLTGIDATGKILVVEGMPAPGRVSDAMHSGAIAGIFINPGEYIHESIVTTIWGSPDFNSKDRQPAIPVLGVNRADGNALIALARQGATASFSTTVKTGWWKIPVLVAEIRGQQYPDEFVLLHGHVDSWHVGVGDNATGDATMLELARVFQQHRQELKRSIRIGWWSGHSHGRYAGSTWYADAFGIDLANNCIAQVNCDSPGCRDADTFIELTCMPEAERLVTAVVRDVAGLPVETERPPRAGDYSFNGIGITSYLMLSSTMSRAKREELGLYGVGGCGANIQWHSEDDTMEIADRENLLRDMKVYAIAVLRPVNAPLHPFDWRRTVEDMLGALDDYERAAGDLFNLRPVELELINLMAALEWLYAVAHVASRSPRKKPLFNATQRRLARFLAPVNNTQCVPFQHDPAMEIPRLPDLALAKRLPALAGDTAAFSMAIAQLTRGQNRIVWSLQQARELVEWTTIEVER